MSAKFDFILRTRLDSGKTSEAVLGSTDNRVRATMLRNRFTMLSGGTLPERRCKKVKVVKLDAERYDLFNTRKMLAPKAGQIFNSIDALAAAIDANPVTLRAGISNAKQDKKTMATVRGVTYAYVS